MDHPLQGSIEAFWHWEESALLAAMVPADEEERIRAEVVERHLGRARGLAVPPGPDAHEDRDLRGAVRDHARGVMESFVASARQYLCAEWGYCAKRESLRGEGVALALAVADGLLAFGTGIPVPIAAASVYLVKFGVLDNLCGCGPLPEYPPEPLPEETA